MKVAVIGSRNIVVENVGEYLPNGVTEIVSGGARGVDSCAREYALQNNIKLTEFLPDYNSARDVPRLNFVEGGFHLKSVAVQSASDFSTALQCSCSLNDGQALIESIRQGCATKTQFGDNRLCRRGDRTLGRRIKRCKICDRQLS